MPRGWPRFAWTACRAGASRVPAIVPPGRSLATVTIETMADMEAGQSAVKIKAWVGGDKADEREITFNVEKPAAALPSGQTRATARRSSRNVSPSPRWITCKLVGTLYPGSKGKNGACVLMLPEVGQHSRAEPAAWQRLAEAIQAEGHTVLTFDFRGQGASKSVTADFWKFSVNRALPVYGKTRWEDGVPVTIDADENSRRIHAVDDSRHRRRPHVPRLPARGSAQLRQ